MCRVRGRVRVRVRARARVRARVRVRVSHKPFVSFLTPLSIVRDLTHTL